MQTTSIRQIELEHEVRELKRENYDLRMLASIRPGPFKIQDAAPTTPVMSDSQDQWNLHRNASVELCTQGDSDTYTGIRLWGVDKRGRKLQLNNFVSYPVIAAENNHGSLEKLLESILNDFVRALYVEWGKYR